MELKTPIDSRQREIESIVITQFFKKFPTEVLATLAAWYRPDLKRWASKFRREFYRPEIPLKDYEAVAISSLADAAKNFDGTASTRFSTYLYAYARNECRKLAYNTSNNFRVFNNRKKKKTEQYTSPESSKNLNKSKATYASRLEDLTGDDVIYTADANENSQRKREKKDAQRKVQQLRELLEDNWQQEGPNSLKVPQKHADLVLSYMDFFLKNADDASKGRSMKKAFLDSRGKKNRGTLDKALDSVCKKFSCDEKRTVTLTN